MGLKVELSVAIDMTDINFSNLLYGTPTKHTSSDYVLKYNGGYSDAFHGHGFKYTNQGVPNGGTVESFIEYHGGKQLFSITHGSISAKAIAHAAMTEGLNDDVNLIIKAMKGADEVTGSNGNDVLYAAGGNDTLDGKGGRDTILSGPGADTMTGGGGADVFYFILRGHSTASKQGMDTITDFSHADRIDLTNIGNYDFIRTDRFSGNGHELRFVNQHGETYIYADTDGDKQADFAIHLKHSIHLTENDFYM